MSRYEPTKEQINEAALLGIKLDGRWGEEAISNALKHARIAAEREDRMNEERVSGLSAHEMESLERQMTFLAAQRASGWLHIYLDFDLWLGEHRIRADHETPMYLPFEEAQRMVVIGKARHADLALVRI